MPDNRVLKRHDSGYGGGSEPHGPWSYPVGMTIFNTFRNQRGSEDVFHTTGKDLEIKLKRSKGHQTELAGKFWPVNTDELEWVDGEKLFGLPPGVKVKILAKGRDKISWFMNKLVEFPAGYTLPSHTHPSYHSCILIEGEAHVAGKVLKRGGYVYGGGSEPHGPCYYPLGATLFVSSRGLKVNQSGDLDMIHKFGRN